MIKEKLSGYFARVFSIDYRSLAIFRIALALLILFDLSFRARALVAHYTNSGVLFTSAIADYYGHSSFWSFHLLSGSLWFQIVLFIIAAVFAFFLLIGWHSRIFMFLSWLMLISLQTRNPMILQGGDIFLRVIAFWAIFLPLGKKWAVDALRQKNINNKKEVFSFGSAGLLLQIAIVYFFSALLKNGSEWTPDGTAVYFALSIDQFATHFGKWLLMQSSLLPFLTYAVYYFELIGPFLLFVPFFFGPIRTIIAFGFVLLQFGMGIALHLGPFPWVASFAMIAFLPAWFWDKFIIGKKIENIFDNFGDKIRFSKLNIYRFRVNYPIYKENKFNKILYFIMNVVAAFFIAYIFLWNVQTLGRDAVPNKAEWVAYVTRTDQMWNMFSPYPLKEDGWYVIPATLADGSKVDLFRDGLPVSWDKPPHVAALYPHERWRKYMMNLWDKNNAGYRQYYLDYLCYEWNSEHEGQKRAVEVEMYFMEEFTLDNYEHEPVEKVLLHSSPCYN